MSCALPGSRWDCEASFDGKTMKFSASDGEGSIGFSGQILPEEFENRVQACTEFCGDHVGLARAGANLGNEIWSVEDGRGYLVTLVRSACTSMGDLRVISDYGREQCAAAVQSQTYGPSDQDVVRNACNMRVDSGCRQPPDDGPWGLGG